MSEPRIPLSVPHLAGNEGAYLQACVDTNFVSSVGPFVTRFEREFAHRVGAPHAVACASGTAAIHVALQVAGVEAGDEVWVSDFTFIATVNPITYLGARPVLVDADPATWNMDAGLVCDELQRRRRAGVAPPKALLVAHVLGLPAEMAPLVEACEQHGVTLVEDAAEALGAGFAEGPLCHRQVGAVGRLGCFSFNGNKIITTGGGGMIVTAEEALARRARHLTTQARLPGPEYLHDEVGYNYRLTNVAAALGVAQLEQLDAFLAVKLAIARRYDEGLAALPGVVLPPRPSWAVPTMWLYSILIDPGRAAVDRRGALTILDKRGIQARPVWAPAHLMPFYHQVDRLGGGVGERLFDRGLSLPCSVGLSAGEQAEVVELLAAALRGEAT